MCHVFINSAAAPSSCWSQPAARTSGSLGTLMVGLDGIAGVFLAIGRKHHRLVVRGTYIFFSAPPEASRLDFRVGEQVMTKRLIEELPRTCRSSFGQSISDRGFDLFAAQIFGDNFAVWSNQENGRDAFDSVFAWQVRF